VGDALDEGDAQGVRGPGGGHARACRRPAGGDAGPEGLGQS
jgi:hypothetical protein